MGGSYYYDAKAKRYCVQVYWLKKRVRIWRYNGDPLWHEKTADKLLNKIRAEIDDGVFNPKTYFPDSPLTLGIYAKGWLKIIDVSDKCRRDYRTQLNHAISYYGADKDIRHLRHNDFLLFHQSLKMDKKGKGKYNVLSTLRTMLKTAYRNEDIQKMPPFPKLSYDPPGKIEYLTMEQQVKVVQEIPERDRPIFMFAMEYGLRIGEVRAIQKDCIADGLLIIKRAFSDNALRERTKTGAVREYDLTHYAQAILDSLPITFSQFVFTREDQKPYTNKNLNHIWHEACRKVGIEIKLYNAVRHSLGCQLADEGQDLSFIQGVLGHTRPEMTQRYSHRSNQVVKDRLEGRRKVVDIRGKENST